jgi:hypothetical protein
VELLVDDIADRKPLFFFKVGLKQDDALPVILFSLVLHFVLQKLDIRGNKLTEMVQIRACADDMIMQYKPTNCPFSKSVFHFFYLLHLSNPRALLQEDGCIYSPILRIQEWIFER